MWRSRAGRILAKNWPKSLVDIHWSNTGHMQSAMLATLSNLARARSRRAAEYALADRPVPNSSHRP